MKSPTRVIFLGIAVALVTIPAAVFLTFLMSPFWEWFESTTGIEAYGHFGPSGWCYVVSTGIVFAVCAAIVPVIAPKRFRGSRK